MPIRVLLIISLLVPPVAATGVVVLGHATLPDASIGAAVEMVSEPVDVGSGTEIREEFRQSYPFNANGRIVLENLNGAAKFSVWDRNEVQVIAIKRAPSRERMSRVSIDINATPDSLRIKTNHGYENRYESKGWHENWTAVDYNLTVPRQARLEAVELVNGALDIDGVEGDVKASSVNGRVTARGLKGVARLSSVNGGLEVLFLHLDESKPITLNSVNGHVRLVIPSNANAIIRASTVNGGITNDFGLEVKHGEYVGHDLHGQLGTGGPRIRIGNVNGPISIKRNQDGAQLSKATSLLADTDKDKEKYKAREKDYGSAVEREVAVQTRELQREQARAQREAQRAIRQAEIEIRRAQQQVQREVQREAQRQLRAEVRAEGRGVASSSTSGPLISEKETKSFPVAGTPRVVVSTFDGSVIVRGWDKPEVSYTATKRGHDQEDLKGITIKSDQQGSQIHIVASDPQSEGSVTLEVYLPRNASLNASSGDGRLSLDGVGGDLTLRTGDGSIEVSNANGQLKANTGDGRIRVTSFEGQVEARTGDGAISLNGKFSSVIARTGGGSITLVVPGDSNFTIETDAETVSGEGFSITEDVAPSRRMKRWKVGQGGKVFVITTGEGRILLRQR